MSASWRATSARLPQARGKAIAKVRRDQPGVYLKVLALLIPREHKVQHSNSLKDLTDEQLEAMISQLASTGRNFLCGIKDGVPAHQTL
jgi:hypothetical protein